MPVKFGDGLPEDRRQAIEARAAELIEEEATLRELRVARKRSQREIAERLNVQQAAVSKLERRTDMYISTLCEFVRAMSGDLEIVARFPDRRPVRISQFGALAGGADAGEDGCSPGGEALSGSSVQVDASCRSARVMISTFPRAAAY